MKFCALIFNFMTVALLLYDENVSYTKVLTFLRGQAKSAYLVILGKAVKNP